MRAQDTQLPVQAPTEEFHLSVGAAGAVGGEGERGRLRREGMGGGARECLRRAVTRSRDLADLVHLA